MAKEVNDHMVRGDRRSPVSLRFFLYDGGRKIHREQPTGVDTDTANSFAFSGQSIPWDLL